MRLALDYWEQGNKSVAIYSDMLIRDHIKFQYPPQTLFLIRYISEVWVDPQAFFSIATRFFLALTLLSTFLIMLRSMKVFGHSAETLMDKGLLFLLVGVVSLLFYPFVESGNLGQIQLWINALFAVAILCYMGDYMILAGIIIGVMASIKPQYGLFFIWGFLRGNKRFAISVLVSAGLIVLTGLPEFGMSTYFDYLKGLSFLSQHGEAFMANQSMNGFLNRLFSITDPVNYNNANWRGRSFPPYNPVVYYGTLASTVLVLVLALFGNKKNTGYASFIDFCLMGLAVTLASPIAWEHHYGILLPIFTVLGSYFWLNTKTTVPKFLSWLFVLCYLATGNVVPFFVVLAQSRWNFFQSYMFFAAVATFALLWWVRGQATKQSDLIDVPSGVPAG